MDTLTRNRRLMELIEHGAKVDLSAQFEGRTLRDIIEGQLMHDLARSIIDQATDAIENRGVDQVWQQFEDGTLFTFQAPSDPDQPAPTTTE